MRISDCSADVASSVLPAVKEHDHTLVVRAGQLRAVMDAGADARIVVIGNPDQASAIVVDQRQQGVWRDLGFAVEGGEVVRIDAGRNDAAETAVRLVVAAADADGPLAGDSALQWRETGRGSVGERVCEDVES